MSSSADLASRREQLSPAKRALLEQRMRGVRAAQGQAFAIPRRADGGPAPLSFAQQRLWFLDQLAPGNAFYNVSATVPLRFAVQVGALEWALGQIVARHEALRTRFVTLEGRPVQLVEPPPRLRLAVEDLAGPDAEQRALELAGREAATPFELARGPLLRARLLRLAPQHWLLVVCMHHIVSDGWSMGLFFEELTELYSAHTSGRPPQLAELAIQYPDYAVWQRNRLQGELLERQLDYWRDQLADLPLLELPTDHPRPPVQAYRGQRHTTSLPAGLADPLNQLAQTHGATLYMVLLAAFATLLHRYTNQPEIVIGSPIAGRDRTELERLIGFFVNTLVLRIDCTDQPSFTQLLARTRQTALDAYAHQDLPFETLVEHLHPHRDPSRNPLFQVTFQLFNAPTASGEGETVEVERGTAIFDLALHVWETGGGLGVQLEYSTDLFEPDTARRLLGHYRTLLEAIAADPDRPLWQLPLLDQTEQRQLVERCNDTAADYPDQSCLHQLIETQAQQHPDATAITEPGRQTSYSQLNKQANQLAHQLRQHQIGPETLVGICLERSTEMVIALLAIHKAGGAYLPLDPAYPPERLAYMLADAQAPLVITTTQHQHRLPPTTPTLPLDQHPTHNQPTTNPQPNTQPHNLAYTIYTSGSTGQPKGTLIEHRSAVNHMAWMERALGIAATDTVLLRTPLSFDASVWEWALPLTVGARLVVAGVEDTRDPRRLFELIAREKVTTLQLTPSLLRGLLEVGGLERCRSLSRVMVGGEALPRDVAERFGELDLCPLFNLYGPTEATIDATWFRCVGGGGAGSVPIGRPIANVQAYVLDDHGQPVPIGVAGELHIGGVGVARGYLGRPELSAERFVPDPFNTTPDARLYKTGDLARRLPDGNLEFLGRRDHQIKLRGYRIELEEIEAALASHPRLRAAAVTLDRSTPAGERLVAYLVPSPGHTPDPVELRGWLGGLLPEFMVPAGFVVLEALPLTANGKLDRAALPVPDGGRPDLGVGFEAPGGGVESVLAGVWCEVLGLERVGRHDNFFELGGDSIVSIQIVARANQAGLGLSVQQLFSHQTVAELAAVAGSAPLVVAEQGQVLGEVELTPVQDWFFSQPRRERHHFNQSLLLELEAEPPQPLLRAALAGLVEHHDALRLRYSESGKGWRQHSVTLERAGPVRLERIELAHEDELRAACARVQASLELEHGPLLAGAWLDHGPGRPGRLLLVCHHLVIDAVSWRVLLEDLHTALTQLAAGRPLELPPKTSSFAAWAKRLHQHAHTDQLAAELPYWLEQSAHQLALPNDKPTDGPGPAGQARHHTITLAAPHTQALLKHAPAAGLQTPDLLICALALALRDWTASDDISLDLEAHGREPLFDDIDLTRTVGWFTAIHPLRLHLPNPDPAQALQTTKQTLRQIPNHGIGYGLLRWTRQHPDLTNTPPNQIAFNYLGQLGPRQPQPNTTTNTPDPTTTGPAHSPTDPRPYQLEINTHLTTNTLHTTLTHNPHQHTPQTINTLAHNYHHHLQTLTNHLQQPQTITPHRHPAARASQRDLDRLVAKLGGDGREDSP